MLFFVFFPNSLFFLFNFFSYPISLFFFLLLFIQSFLTLALRFHPFHKLSIILSATIIQNNDFHRTSTFLTDMPLLHLCRPEDLVDCLFIKYVVLFVIHAAVACIIYKKKHLFLELVNLTLCNKIWDLSFSLFVPSEQGFFNIVS